MSKETFQIRINGGRKRNLVVKTSVYVEAVAAIPGILGTKRPFDVEIWCDRLLPDYGPYQYRCTSNEFGQFVVQHLLPVC